MKILNYRIQVYSAGGRTNMLLIYHSLTKTWNTAVITNYNGDVYNFLFFLHLSCDYLILFPEQSDKIRQTFIGLIQITVKNSSYNFGPMETSFVFVAEGSE